MQPRRSTRMGPAIRHALAKLDREGARMKVLIVVSDGFPEDTDYGPDRNDHEYGIQDTARALQEAAATVTGQHGEALKQRLRTGTVVTYDDRNWELRFTQERLRINQSRAIAVDMESGTIATQGYRLRVPYDTVRDWIEYRTR